MKFPKITLIVNAVEDVYRIQPLVSAAEKMAISLTVLQVSEKESGDSLQDRINGQDPELILIFSYSFLSFPQRIRVLKEVHCPIFVIWFESPLPYLYFLEDWVETPHIWFLTTDQVKKIPFKSFSVCPYPYWHKKTPQPQVQSHVLTLFPFFTSLDFTFFHYYHYPYDDYFEPKMAFGLDMETHIKNQKYAHYWIKKQLHDLCENSISRVVRFGFDCPSFSHPRLDRATIPVSAEQIVSVMQSVQAVVKISHPFSCIYQEVIQAMALGKPVYMVDDFVFSETVIALSDWKELSEKQRFYDAHPAELNRIVQKAEGWVADHATAQRFLNQIGKRFNSL